MKGYFFIGARTGAGEKIPGAGQKWTGSATLIMVIMEIIVNMVIVIMTNSVKTITLAILNLVPYCPF